jgi:ADP-ribose pyrophosphatase
MLEWTRQDPTKVEQVGWRTIVTKTFTLPDGTKHDFQLFNKEGTHNAGVIAITPDRKVIVARQYRPGPEKMMDEIPGGGVEAGETDYAAAALRELLEETGYTSSNVTHLGDIYKDAYSNSTWHYYLAKDCVLHADGAQPDEREFIDIQHISVVELLTNARQGRMTDTEAVFLAYQELNAMMEGNDAS